MLFEAVGTAIDPFEIFNPPCRCIEYDKMERIPVALCRSRP